MLHVSHGTEKALRKHHKKHLSFGLISEALLEWDEQDPKSALFTGRKPFQEDSDLDTGSFGVILVFGTCTCYEQL